MTCSALPIFKEEGYPCSLPKATSATNSSSPRGSSSRAGGAPLSHTEGFRTDPVFPQHWTAPNPRGRSLEAPNGSNGELGWWMQREGGECLQGTEEQRKGVNAINPECSWKEGRERSQLLQVPGSRLPPRSIWNPGTKWLKSSQVICFMGVYCTIYF